VVVLPEKEIKKAGFKERDGLGAESKKDKI
jgi:hypothetical protein